MLHSSVVRSLAGASYIMVHFCSERWLKQLARLKVKLELQYLCIIIYKIMTHGMAPEFKNGIVESQEETTGKRL